MHDARRRRLREDELAHAIERRDVACVERAAAPTDGAVALALVGLARLHQPQRRFVRHLEAAHAHARRPSSYRFRCRLKLLPANPGKY